MSYLDRAIAAEAAARAQAAGTNFTSAYRTVKDFGTFELTGLATGTYLLLPGAPGSAVASGSTGSARAGFYYDASQHAVSGKTLQTRIVVQLLVNATAPTSTFTTSIQLAGAVAGSASPNIALGSAPSPAMSVTQATPGANNKTTNGSGDQANSGWSATWYVPQLVISGANMAASSFVALSLLMQCRNT